MSNNLRWALAPGAAERGVKIPERKPGDVGWNMAGMEDVTIPPGEFAFIKTGITGVAPKGWHFSVQNRTSKGRDGIFAAAVVFDQSYRASPTDQDGFVLGVRNVGKETLHYRAGVALVQLVLYPVWEGAVEVVAADSFDATDRGSLRYGGRDDGAPDPVGQLALGLDK